MPLDRRQSLQEVSLEAFQRIGVEGHEHGHHIVPEIRQEALPFGLEAFHQRGVDEGSQPPGRNPGQPCRRAGQHLAVQGLQDAAGAAAYGWPQQLDDAGMQNDLPRLGEFLGLGCLAQRRAADQELLFIRRANHHQLERPAAKPNAHFQGDPPGRGGKLANAPDDSLDSLCRSRRLLRQVAELACGCRRPNRRQGVAGELDHIAPIGIHCLYQFSKDCTQRLPQRFYPLRSALRHGLGQRRKTGQVCEQHHGMGVPGAAGVYGCFGQTAR